VRIGIDFDNTIACYDAAFHSAALSRGLIPRSVAVDKTSVRDHLRAQGRDSDFTLLQGFVYGPGILLGGPFPGFVEGARRADVQGHELHVISHKTREPFAGPPYDLHAAARDALDHWGLLAPLGPLRPEQVHFEGTQADKIRRIGALNCDLFIDDLPEVLTAEDFPGSVRRILFDPSGRAPETLPVERFDNWTALFDAVLVDEPR
jgi:hypothetical protein